MPFDDNCQQYEAEYQNAFAVFLEKVGKRIPAELVTIGKRLKDKVAWVKHEIARPPTTFLHGDFHPNNLFLMDGP